VRARTVSGAAGVLAETLETATNWANLPRLDAAVRSALTAAPPLVMCHISHVYPAGASLYYTVACAQAPDPIAQRATAKPPPATTSPPPAAQSPTITRSAPTTVTG
jgi:hypothetical protein